MIINLNQKKHEKLIYVPHSISSSLAKEETAAIIQKNIAALIACDKRAKELGSLVGRVFSQPVDGGSAYYQIIEENSKYVHISSCCGMGADLMMPNWGWKASVKKDYVVFRLKELNLGKISDINVRAV